MLRQTVICLMSFCLAVFAAGQEAGRNFTYFEDTHPEFRFINAASLSSFGEGKVSTAFISSQKDNGKLISISDSPDGWSANTGTESYMRISDRIAIWGNLSYTYFRGQDMGAQILVSPDDNPVNFLEEDLTTVGEKKKESYYVAGGLAYAFSNRFSGGVHIDYTACDQVKYKDPRFLDVLMDMNVAPGLMLSFSDDFSLGFNLLYRHSVEQLSAGSYGTKDKTYHILVDLGGFYGYREIFEGDNGYVSLSNIRYLYSDWYGVGLQAITGNRVKTTHDLQAAIRSGYFGSKTSGSVVFCECSGPSVSYSLSSLLQSGDNLHKLALSASWVSLSNYTNSYKATIIPGMNTEITYQGQTRTLDRNDIDASLAYTMFKGVGGYLPQWEFDAAANTSCRFQSTLIYPFQRDWSSIRAGLSVKACRNIASGHSIYSCALSTGFHTGFGNPRGDSSSASGSTTLKSFDDYSNRQFEYETAARMGAGIELIYTRIISARFVPYAKISDSFVSLLSDPQYLDGKTRNVATVSLGCNF